MVHGPHDARVDELPPPVPRADEVVVEVERAGLCGTDVEFFTGEMAYLHTGHAAYPMRLGHEWAGKVSSLGSEVDPSWAGRRVTGDTMLGCQRCRRCRHGYQHVCDYRTELGVRGGRPGALAEFLAVPVWSIHPLPDQVDATCGALVEPGANALRAVEAAALRPGERLLVLGPGAIGLLCALHARAQGVDVVMVGVNESTVFFARDLGIDAYDVRDMPGGLFDAVIDATNDRSAPARAVELVEPGRRVVYIGLAPKDSVVDTRSIALKDVTAVGILGGSQGLSRTIAAYADGSVDPSPLVAATVSLEEVASVLAGDCHIPGPGPKVLVDPSR